MNRLTKLKIAEISLVKRGAVPTARIALAKAELSSELRRAPSPRPLTRAVLATAMESYAEKHRAYGESRAQAMARMLRQDLSMQNMYEAYNQAIRLENGPSEVVLPPA